MLKKAKEKRFSSPNINSTNTTTTTSFSSLNKFNSQHSNVNASNIYSTPTNQASFSASTNSFSSSNSSRMLAAQSLAILNETNLIETFYELEAEIEKGICRDNITFNSIDKEHGTYIKFLILV